MKAWVPTGAHNPFLGSTALSPREGCEVTLLLSCGATTLGPQCNALNHLATTYLLCLTHDVIISVTPVPFAFLTKWRVGLEIMTSLVSTIEVLGVVSWVRRLRTSLTTTEELAYRNDS